MVNIEDLTQEKAIAAIRLAVTRPGPETIPDQWVLHLLNAYDQNEAALFIARDGQKQSNERLDAVTTEMIEWRRKYTELAGSITVSVPLTTCVAAAARIVENGEEVFYGESLEQLQLGTAPSGGAKQ